MTRRYITTAALRGIEAQLTEQDCAILRRVCGLRFVTGSQLTRMHFTDEDAAADARAARRVLLRLVRLDVLERLPRQVGGARSGSAGFVYRLGRAGQRLAAQRGWQPERSRRRSQVPGSLFVRHALRVAELHTLLVEADRSRSVELLELVAEPACWRSYGGVRSQRVTLKPDSYARLGLGDFEDSYFIEVDMGTEGSRALDRQLKAYLAYFDSGREQAEHGVFPKVLWLTPDAERGGVIEDRIRRLPRASRELFQVARFDDAASVVTNTLRS